MGFGSQDGSDAGALSPRQARIVAQLARLVSRGAADFFHDACRMVTETPPHPSGTHLISHALREVDSALRYVLEAHAVPEKAGTVEPGECEACGREMGGHLRSVTAACQALELPNDHPVAVVWREQTVRSSSNLAGRAHRHALERPRPVDREFLAFFTRMEDLLRNALGPEAPQTIFVLSALAGALWSAGRFSQAVSLGEEAWTIRSRLLGPRHPDTLGVGARRAVRAVASDPATLPACAHRPAHPRRALVTSRSGLDATRSASVTTGSKMLAPSMR